MSKFKITQKRTSSFSSMKNEAVLRGRQGSPKTTRLKNGQSISATSSPQTYAIATETETLSKQGLISQPTNPSETSNSLALSMLNAIGCSTISGMGADFSLIANQTDAEVINNPNLIDPATVKKKKRKKDASQMFKNSNDAFYELDDDVPQTLQIETENRQRTLMAPNVVTLAANIATINKNITTNFKLKEFK